MGGRDSIKLRAQGKRHHFLASHSQITMRFVLLFLSVAAVSTYLFTGSRRCQTYGKTFPASPQRRPLRNNHEFFPTMRQVFTVQCRKRRRVVQDIFHKVRNLMQSDLLCTLALHTPIHLSFSSVKIVKMMKTVAPLSSFRIKFYKEKLQQYVM